MLNKHHKNITFNLYNNKKLKNYITDMKEIIENYDKSNLSLHIKEISK